MSDNLEKTNEDLNAGESKNTPLEENKDSHAEILENTDSSDAKSVENSGTSTESVDAENIESNETQDEEENSTFTDSNTQNINTSEEDEVKVIAETPEAPIDEEHHQEIEDANAEDSEDEDNATRHHIELKDYEAMSMDSLVIELEQLLKKEKVQAIREHVTQIKIAFDKKFNEVTEEKRDEFLSNGGNIIDFHYSSAVKTKFNRIYFDYREKRDNYYKNLKKNLNENLKNRLSLIEELKGMIGTGRDMKATFANFKDLQERWKNAGPVPRTEYSQLWKNYHHHVERFYDFLHLDREFRDLDFQHNLDQIFVYFQKINRIFIGISKSFLHILFLCRPLPRQ